MPETDLFLYDTGARSDVGRVRDHNEDSLLARPDYGLWVVADGMGGHAAGDFASQTIVAELAEIGVPGSLDDLQARVMLRLGQATRAIQARSAALGGVTVGATLVAPGEDINVALARADEWLYEAKRTGRNRVGYGPAPAGN